MYPDYKESFATKKDLTDHSGKTHGALSKSLISTSAIVYENCSKNFTSMLTFLEHIETTHVKEYVQCHFCC